MYRLVIKVNICTHHVFVCIKLQTSTNWWSLITKVKLLPRSDNSWYESISCSTVPHLSQFVSCFSLCLTMCHFSNHQSLYHVNITMHHCVSSCIIVYHHVTSCIIVYHPLEFYELSSLVTVSHCITTYVLHCCPLVSAL